MTVCVPEAASHAVSRGATSAAHAMTPPIGGSSSSSSSLSSLDDRREFHELVHRADESHQRYSDATHKVSRLECCLDAIRVALEASERETATAQVVATDA